MTDSLFEVITQEEFEESGGRESELPFDGHWQGLPPDVELTWCEFCKGYYIMEFHFGDKEGGDSQ